MQTRSQAGRSDKKQSGLKVKPTDVSIEQIILENLNNEQREAVTSEARNLLVIAGAGSGKTEVMARRIAWWLAIKGVPREKIIAFTFTEAAAEELKFRIRTWIQKVTPEGGNPTLDGMYIGTIHGFCLKCLRDLDPDTYYDFEVLDELSRFSLVQRGAYGVLGLKPFLDACGERGDFAAKKKFLRSYDLLNEYDLLDVQLADEEIPNDVAQEKEWCKKAKLLTNVGDSAEAVAFADSAGRMYAYLRARRFLDFSTSQSELTRLLRNHPERLKILNETFSHVVVDEVQDINPVQKSLIDLLVGNEGYLTAVGDHRQAIYGFRGGRVDLMGELHKKIQSLKDGKTVYLPANYRSTPKIIEIANKWAGTIGKVGSMPTPDMKHAAESKRLDRSKLHIALNSFTSRDDEAKWIIGCIRKMVDKKKTQGAFHNNRQSERGIGYSDIAVLVRSSTDVRTYQNALIAAQIPAVVRAGPDLFSQPEVLLVTACLAKIGGMAEFFGRKITEHITNSLNCQNLADEVIPAAINVLRAGGLGLADDLASRLKVLCEAIHEKIGDGEGAGSGNISSLRCLEAKKWLKQKDKPRRIFPQKFMHWLLEEIGVGDINPTDDRAQVFMFHLGQLSGLVKGLETPGWTRGDDFKYQIISLVMWGAESGRTTEAPLLVPPNAVTITTIHQSKGLEFPVVFVADVNALRFPSSRAKVQTPVAFCGKILETINLDHLRDNNNYDSERRLMYVALSRAERYLFISHSGSKTSQFVKELRDIAGELNISRDIPIADLEKEIDLKPVANDEEKSRLTTSFSDIHYYIECPHDFYLRKALGFTPAIDQAFGYGKAVHNILRHIHENSEYWAQIADKPDELANKLKELTEGGMFYLRYTTGEPLENMRRAAQVNVKDYVMTYSDELKTLEFEPERDFETLIEEENLLISGTIDLVRLDNPPRVTIVDFKSGERGDVNASGLSEDMMALQIGVYGLASRHELEYDPSRGLVRYVGEKDKSKKELVVELDEKRLKEVRESIIDTGKKIKGREFFTGPVEKNRCQGCDFLGFCGMNEARACRNK